VAIRANATNEKSAMEARSATRGLTPRVAAREGAHGQRLCSTERPRCG